MEKVAIVQDSPVLLNREQTLTRMVERVAEAAAAGATLIVFPEAFISGYPAWIWRLRPGGDWGACEALHARLLDSAVDLSTNQLQPLLAAARQHQVTIVTGLNERDSEGSGATLYNAVLVIGKQGEVLNHHRKLMPTNPERMVWGFGDGTGLKVVNTEAGKLGSLICWENYMPLARFALYSQGVEVYIAPTYDSGDDWLGTMQHIAREGRCWVINSGVVLHRDDIPEDFPERDRLYSADETWINPGDSAVIAPGGEIVAGPLHQAKGILYAEYDPARAVSAKRALDVAGHYARPDILQLHVNTRPQPPVSFD